VRSQSGSARGRSAGRGGRTGMTTDGLATGTLGRSGFSSSASRTGYSSSAPPHCEREGRRVSCARLRRRARERDEGTHLGLPCGLVEDEVEDEADAPGPDHVVVVQEVAPLGVLGARHVGLCAAEGPAAGDVLEEGAELLAVDGVAQLEEGREDGEFVGGEARQVAEVARLVDLRAGGGDGSARECVKE